MYEWGQSRKAGMQGMGTREWGRERMGTFVQSVPSDYYDESVNPLTSPPAKLPL